MADAEVVDFSVEGERDATSETFHGLPTPGPGQVVVAAELVDDGSVTATPLTAYDEWSKEDLKAEAEARSLPKGGTKEELIARLYESDEDNSE